MRLSNLHSECRAHVQPAVLNYEIENQLTENAFKTPWKLISYTYPNDIQNAIVHG